MEDFEKELQELEEKEADRLAAESLATKRMRHAELKLSAEFTAKLGERGKEFELYVSPFGVFGVKVPDYIKYKVFLDKSGGEQGVEAAQIFASSCLITDASVFNAECAKRPGLGVHMANAACELAGLLDKKRRSK